MAYDPNIEIYRGKSLGSLFEDIVVNSENKRNQLDVLVSDLRSMIKTPENALMVVPLLKDYLEVGVRNDEQLIKLAAIVQRLTSAASAAEEAGGFAMSEEEKRQLMSDLEQTTKRIAEQVDESKAVALKEKTE